jgi:hypothetical protein
VFKNRYWRVAFLILVAGTLHYFFESFLEADFAPWIRILLVFLIIGVGAGVVLNGAAKIIEETTEVLSEKTKLAGGVLQSVGTAFPDMALGVVAAVISLRVRETSYSQAIEYAIIAAATTFGSNIYNIGHAIWCVFRQNLANKLNQSVLMFPFFRKGGEVIPMQKHERLPFIKELDTALDVVNILTVLTAMVALGMVLFGRILNSPSGMAGDLYQLIKPVGGVIFLFCVVTIYLFRKNQREASFIPEIEREEKYYRKVSGITIWIHLLISGVAILFAAEAMIHSVRIFSQITGLPYVVSGVLAGVIGCLGEMLVIHNYTIHPKGRIGDALVGVAMDNIVTTLGASIVALMGGIFLGGNALILIFVIILTLNSVLLWQISRLKNFFIKL